jgi:uncharacterized protein (DUF1778 family)
MIRVRYRRFAPRLTASEALSNFFRRLEGERTQETLADQQRIALNQEEATRFLDALDVVNQGTVVGLRELRDRA